MKNVVKALPTLIAVVCAGLVSIYAQERKFPDYSGHVNDFANVIDVETKQRLETILTNFENLTGAQIAVVTVKSLNDQPIEDYAIDLYRKWGIGAKSGEHKDKGALLLVAINDRKTRLEVGYGLEGDLPDGLAGEIIRRMRPYLQQGQFAQGMNVGVRTLVDTLSQKWNISLAGIEDRRYAYEGSGQPQAVSRKSLLLLLLFGFILILVMSAIARSRGKGGGRGGGGGSGLWWGYPIIFNRGGGTFGCGSWGSGGGWGGSSGGGWGGFGGGSSGGGGASDSW
ncbi:MAG: TPM domain-containing protein [Acidobacteria bacterium]|nr:TPM domain-containing protein [Acidobacteriota bacterium]